MNLSERLEATYAELSPQEQRAADFMRGHLDDLAVYNATEVAGLSGVSKATVSRLYRRLGFRGADELREHLRTVRGAPRADAVAHPDDALEQEIANLRAVAALDLAPAATLIAEARRVVVIGFRNSYPVALHLREQLAQARDLVSLAPLPGQTVGEELAGLDAQDVVVLVGFRRRPAGFAALATAVAATPARGILITDASGRRLASDLVLECPLDTPTAFDSYAAAAHLVARLASAVLALSDPARLASVGAALRSELE
ncbi:MAG: RpiR family transcriptional regulator [Microbacteriaceae bacterium]|nr:RpiR family transcriptional regulator [Microbacteriaceae bacterium]